MPSRPIDRRHFLQGVGVALSLPLLDAMRVQAAEAGTVPRRMIAIQTNQGIVPKFFFPQGTGRSYSLSPYLEQVKEFRDSMTVFSGVSHPEVDGGHHAEECFLTAAPHPGRGGFHNTISLDQYAAERIGHLTRFPSLSLSVGTNESISYTGAGVQIPGDDRPSQLFQRLFVQGSSTAVESQIQQLRRGRSILDSVAERAKQLNRKVGPTDRAKLDQYFTGVRELEQRLHKSEEWERQPKPKVNVPMPNDITDRSALLEKMRAMFDMAQLAIATDSTRLITIYVYQNAFKPNIAGVDEATHPLTHHGNQPAKLRQLQLIEGAQFQELNGLLTKLRNTSEGSETLLDRTMVLYGTPLGNGNNHSNLNLPMVLAGGGFQHGQHLAMGGKHDYPLPNLFVSMLQRLGIGTDRFASGSSTFTGLEMKA